MLGTCFIALVVKNCGKWTNVWEELIYFVSQILPSAGLLISGIKIPQPDRVLIPFTPQKLPSHDV